MQKTIISILLFTSILFINFVTAQEILTGLSENPTIKSFIQSQGNEKSSVIEQPDPLLLPFFDNFKKTSVFPDQSKWMDKNVFINNDFALFPPTWNVATFDAIDSKGNLYPDANFVSFIADYLTSKPIRLDSIFSPQPKALSPADSVYFSFYYQPQGLANDPQTRDSLVLEFGHYTDNYIFSYLDSITVDVAIFGIDTIYPGDFLFSPCDELLYIIAQDTLFPGDQVTLPCDSVFVPETKWDRIWATKGMRLDSFLLVNNNQYFKQVMIPIIDSAYFRNDFQFRFFNYASISTDNLQSWQSNCDQWNIDYVLLDKGRSRNDSTHKALTFVGQAPSFLNQYQSMPYYQYSNDPTSVIKQRVDIYISNLDNGNQTANYYYEVKNDQGSFTFGFDAGSDDLLPFNQAGYASNPSFAHPPVTTFFPPFGNRDSIYFDITHYLEGDLLLGLADTLRFRQKFFNYYAYDDGTAEFGYGLTPTGAQLAYKFTLSRRDTLRAIQMYFNKTLTGANERYFHLAVWGDLNGIPGDLLYIKENQKPLFGNELFEFQTYYLDEPLPVQGTFYVGWIQQTSNNLNLGFDASNDVSDKIFYNVTGEWVNSSYKGALMIRPLLGKKIGEQPPEKATSANNFLIVPNPSKDGKFEIQLQYLTPGNNKPQLVIPDNEREKQIIIEIFTLSGQKVFTSTYKPEFALEHLKNGIYLVSIIDHYQRSHMVQKLVIAK